ncbi:MAG: RNA 2',3'-cyclic phosphodiesterase, partial [Eubacteriales bacterium]|nr:RNA 2',3'-cyclic phosphodiesterase [Eubacteriales bacterium]
MRAFIGIDFENSLKNQIYELQQEFKKYAINGRWKHRDNFHLTLKFLNEISTSQQAQIDAALKKLCIEKKYFNLKFGKPNIFEGRDSVRVLWIGILGDLKQLYILQQEIDKAIKPLGFSAERRKFKPHITIGQDIVFERRFEEIQSYFENVQLEPIRV